MRKIIGFLILISMLSISTVRAESPSLALVFGLNQPLVLNGGNFEIDYLTDDWVFEFSHGFDLQLDNASELAMTKEERAQGLKINAPYSTGGGIGYRLTEELNVRLEFKQHEFEVTNRSGEKVNYTTQDLGVGVYYFLKPYENSGLLIVPSIRYWPTINTSLNNDKYVFKNGDVHEAHDFGLFANVSVGWQF